MRLIVDVSGLVYTCAWHAMQTCQSESKMLVDAAFEVYEQLAEYLSLGIPPTEIVLAYDGGREARKRLYPAYKKNRDAGSEIRQIVGYTCDLLYRLGDYMPFIQLREPGVEADDLIAEVAAKGYATIVSKDRDLWQLTRFTCVEMYNYQGRQIQLSLRPAQYLIYKVLVGDPSDNIKGVLGVGDVTARALLEDYGSLRNILAYAKEQGKLGRMEYADVVRVVNRNIKLMRLDGSLLSQSQKARLRLLYTAQSDNRRIDMRMMKAELGESFSRFATLFPFFENLQKQG